MATPSFQLHRPKILEPSLILLFSQITHSMLANLISSTFKVYLKSNYISLVQFTIIAVLDYCRTLLTCIPPTLVLHFPSQSILIIATKVILTGNLNFCVPWTPLGDWWNQWISSQIVFLNTEDKCVRLQQRKPIMLIVVRIHKYENTNDNIRISLSH